MFHLERRGEAEVPRAHGLCWNAVSGSDLASGMTQRGLLAGRDGASLTSSKGSLVPCLLILQCSKCALRVKPWG